VPEIGEDRTWSGKRRRYRQRRAGLV